MSAFTGVSVRGRAELQKQQTAPVKQVLFLGCRQPVLPAFFGAPGMGIDLEVKVLS
jgi:hypothetical protein